MIPIADIPSDDEQELMNMGIFEFDRGANNVQAICVGLYCPERGCGVDMYGNDWPGQVIAGRKGMYRRDREHLIAASLRTYKGGVNGGRTRLMQTPLPIEADQEHTIDGVVHSSSAVVLGEPEDERLAARLPRIMGD